LPPQRWLEQGARRVRMLAAPGVGPLYTRLRPQSLRTRLLLAASSEN